MNDESKVPVKKVLGAEQIIPMVTAVISIIWLAYGIPHYGWINEKGPTLGFLPVTCAAIMLVMSIIQFIKVRKKDNTSTYLPESFLIWACLFAVWGASYIIGTLPALIVFFVLWLKLFEREPWLKTIIMTVVFFVAVYLIFVLWIKVPFMKGELVEMILRH